MAGEAVVIEAVNMLFTVIISLVGAGVGLDWLGYLHNAYKKAMLRLEDERWLLENCRDPLFFSKMRAHTTVCSEVEANARVGAFWVALREATDVFKVSWQPCMVWVGVVIIIILPMCWVCMARASTTYCTARKRKMWEESLPCMRESQTC